MTSKALLYFYIDEDSKKGRQIKFAVPFFGISEKAVIFYFTPGLSSYPAVKIAAKNVTATPTIITVPML
jgi:hypothetical protein